MKFYLDTEFNGHQGELISIALIAQDGTYFYMAQEPQKPIFWVRNHVIPNLMIPYSRPLILRSEFQRFIQEHKDPEIICDWHADAYHFLRLLEGPDYDSSLDFACRITLLKTPPGQPISRLPHNALEDARALMEWHNNNLGE